MTLEVFSEYRPHSSRPGSPRPAACRLIYAVDHRPRHDQRPRFLAVDYLYTWSNVARHPVVQAGR
jgi:hypothetical protein